MYNNRYYNIAQYETSSPRFIVEVRAQKRIYSVICYDLKYDYLLIAIISIAYYY